MRIVRSISALLLACIFCTLSYAAVADRITSAIDSSQMVVVKGNVHGFAKPDFDLGRADGSRLIQGVSLTFRLSAAQQKDLDQFLAQLADRSSANYHKYLTPAQYADRFGMSRNDINKVAAWIQSQGFANVTIAKNRNHISFDGTVAQIESVFALEMHNYLVDGEIHLANATNPSVPAALSGAILYMGHLHDFAPKPRVKVKSNLTSYVSGNHFMTPADFATIYDLNPLYSASATGSNQKIAIVGQSTVSTTDLNNFRTAAGLTASTVTMKLMEGTATRCPGDEGESDLDLEWSGGVAKDASITFVYAGLSAKDTCTSRVDNVWDALQNALETPVAPFVSTSYGFCESGLTAAFAGPNGTLEQWVKNGQALGVTLVAASGDSGAADCEPSGSTSATTGFGVDAPAALPEVTGAGGTEFSADSPTFTTNNPPGANPPYWAAAGATTDTVSSALEYIPEEGWNDTAADIAAGLGMSASGGGASSFFPKPSWQTGSGVPADGQRDVPDISFSASADHDPYLFCSEDGPTNTIVQTCTAGFRTGSGGSFTAVGGTSVAAPTFSAILALVNQYVGNTSSTGLAPVNPSLYQFAGTNPTAFHDVTTGDNKVPCTSGTKNCPTGTTEIGFSAGTGYDQVTGLGSVDGFALAQAFSGSIATFSLTSDLSGGTLTVAQGKTSSAVTLTVNSTTGFIVTSGTSSSTILPVTYSCTGLPSQSTCNFSPSNVSSATSVSFTVFTTPPTTALLRSNGNTRIFYAALLPGLFGIMFTVGSRRRSLGGMRLLGMIVVLGFSTLWLGSCGNSSSATNPGTPKGTSTVTVNATTGGSAPITASPVLSFTLTVN